MSETTYGIRQRGQETVLVIGSMERAQDAAREQANQGVSTETVKIVTLGVYSGSRRGKAFTPTFAISGVELTRRTLEGKPDRAPFVGEGNSSTAVRCPNCDRVVVDAADHWDGPDDRLGWSCTR